ncbi:MAG: 50S ribosomal protein L32 [Bdellovibrionales bacterium]|nr:50S ribosomal protein L32 [Bdellovibrionales bacterium]MBK8204854.1 50S ribosomal protein L32 [Bdellovibrionales bacterium]MBK9038147.1 50S ribosomal protein L32 [Bdellovibrionales bacterium]
MPCPKKKTSRMRKGHRRSHDKAKHSAVHNCPNCGAMYRPHRVCHSCGYYKGTEVVATQA